MPKLRSQDYLCSVCGLRDTHLVELPDDVESRTESCPERAPCHECGSPSTRVFGAPTVLTASYPDGHKRGEGYQLAKEAARLRRARRGIPPTKRGEINREISQLEKRAANKTEISQ